MILGQGPIRSLMRIVLLTFLVFLNTYAQLLGDYVFDFKETYNEVKKVSLEILDLCPPQKCHVVGLGRSPAFITAFLNSIDPQLATNLPLSNFRYNPNGFSRRALSSSMEKKLFNLFDEKLGRILKNYDSVLIVDYSVSGKSILSVNSYVEKYLQDKKITNKNISSFILASSLVEHEILNNAKYFDIRNKPSILSFEKNFPHLFKVMHQSYTDKFAEYEGFYIETEKARMKNLNTKKRESFIRDIKFLIENDSNLGRLTNQRCFGYFIRRRLF